MAALVLSAWLALGTAAVASPEGNAVPEQEDVAAGQAGGSSEPSKQGGSPQSDEQEVHQPPKAQPDHRPHPERRQGSKKWRAI